MGLEVRSSNQLGRRRKTYHRWVQIRKAIQIAVLFVTLSLFIIARGDSKPASVVQLPIYLDPLLVFVSALASRSVQAIMLLALLTVGTTLLFGRVWCGWMCPLGTLIDLFSPRKSRRSKPEGMNISDKLRAIKYLLLFSIILMALWGNLTLLIFDPITILYRFITFSFMPGLDSMITNGESLLASIPALSNMVGKFDVWLRPRIFPYTPITYQYAWLFLLILSAIIALNWIVPRFWCRYTCPLGGLLGLTSKVAILQRRVKEECHQCGVCTRSCPLGTIDPQRGYASDPAECTLCLECLPACPRMANRFTFGLTPIVWNDYDPDRRQFLTTFVLTVLYTAVVSSSQDKTDTHPALLPPGVNRKELLSKCLRCSACIRACPTGALQPAILDSGIEGIWTPVFIPRVGYCDYSCNKCGSICPVEAIPKLDLADKRNKVIGLAHIDRNRCIAWADHQDCIVCEEMCPLPNKAIRLEQLRSISSLNEPIIIQLPHVNTDLCIGCGICEFKCPVVGEAAIRVYPTG